MIAPPLRLSDQGWGGVMLSDAIVAFLGAAGAFLGVFYSEQNQQRRWRADSERGRWSELVQLMAIYEAPDTPEFARKLAWARLNQLELYDAWFQAELRHKVGMDRRSFEDFPLWIEEHRKRPISRWKRRALDAIRSGGPAIGYGALMGALIWAGLKLLG